MRKHRITIKDVARDAGVSISTVSRVMNGAENVNEELKALVNRSIRKLDYVPNSAAQSMKQKKSHIIGIVLSDFALPFFSGLSRKVEEDCRNAGNLVLFVNTYDNPSVERKGLEFLVQKQADVIIIVSTGKNEEYLMKIASRGISVIFIDRRSETHDFPSIYVDKRKGMYNILSFLSGQNHEKICFITGPKELITNKDRRNGALDFYKNPENCDSHLKTFYGDFTTEYALSVMGMLFGEESKWQPTAIIAGNADIACGILLYCRKHGIRIPEDLSLFSYEDYYWGELIEPRLSFLNGTCDVIAEKLISVIHSAFEGKAEPGDYPFDPELVINGSTTCIEK